jgi:hypothetical protein
MRFLRGFGRFWWDFVVGDDWRIAAGVLAVAATGASLVATGAVSDSFVAVLVTAGILLVAVGSIAREARRGSQEKVRSPEHP